jgi:hypothetical protein
MTTRLLEELRVFVWKNGKSQAMQSYNDDLVMAFAIAMYMRETSLKFKTTAEIQVPELQSGRTS